MSSFSSPERVLWVGTYPTNGVAGSGEGIWRIELSGAGRIANANLVVRSAAPSFLALHPAGHTLYAVGETAEGTLRAFGVRDGVLEPRGPAVSSGGAEPCHVVATRDAVWVANYGDGAFSSRPLDPSGALGSAATTSFGPMPAETGGPDGERQAGPHAHFVAELDGRPVVVDLGADIVRDHRDPRAVAAVATLPRGTGPRHFVRLAGGALALVGELDPAVFVLVPGPHGYMVAGRYEACRARPVSGPDRRNYPSHIALSRDGKRLYVAVRGADVISAFAIDAAGPDAAPHAAGAGSDAAPALVPLAEFSGGGVWPRHFAVLAPPAPVAATGVRDLLVVANQESGTLAVLGVDEEGAATQIDLCELPAPACVVEG